MTTDDINDKVEDFMYTHVGDAAYNNKFEAVKLLVEHEADINRIDARKTHISKYAKTPEIRNYLLEHRMTE